MDRRSFFGLALIFALVGAIPLTADGAGSGVVPLRRFALVAGSNNGGPTRMKLKYATSDARSFATVLKELGGVKDGDMLLLIDPRLSEFQDGLRRVQAMMESEREGGERRELLIYYSGHSDDEGLILGTESFPYDELRKQIVDVPSDVRVAVLDSCASGALTRTKGGTWRPAFLFDASTDMKGHAFLTSSSAEESAQESDKIGASFFTHYLVSGLRGAADANGDGLVTLNEAYAFAFQETLASTEKTQYGPQHPAYDINLTGSGDLVLTDLRAASAGLIVAEDVSGRLYIRDARGVLAVELNKPEGQKVELGLEPGAYAVVLDAKDTRYRAEVKISANKRSVLSSTDLWTFSADRTIPRGDAEDEPPASDITEKPRRVEEFTFSFFPDLKDGLFSSQTDRNVVINMLVGTSANMSGFEAGVLANIESETMSGYQAAGLANLVLGKVRGMQLAGIGNFAGRDSRFMQMAGIVNFDMGSFSGFQSAGIVNLNLEDTSGFQMAGIVNYTGGFASGFQAAGISCINAGGQKGAALSGIANVAFGDSSGAQIAGVFNWSQDRFRGAQISGVGNYAPEVAGPQVSLVNVADTVNGAQVGLVNIAGTVKGTQVGLFNFARVIDGIPIGLLTFELAGRQELEVWWDTESSWHAALKLGSRYTHTLLTAGYEQGSDPVRWSYGVGFGGHIPIAPLFLDLDLTLQSVHVGGADWYVTEPGNMLPQFKATLGLPVFGMAVTAGAVVDIYLPYISSEPDGRRTEAARFAPRLFIGAQL
jgi:hypothetical protein